MLSDQIIEKMRESIKPEEWFITNDKVSKLSRKVLYGTNCYAYALGITFSSTGYEKYDESFYIPGFINGVIFDNQQKLFESICSDLKHLRLDYKIAINDISKTTKDEYVIKVILRKNILDDHIEDFHFARMAKNGLWFHKQGWREQPTLYELEEDKRYYYETVGYFIIKRLTN